MRNNVAALIAGIFLLSPARDSGSSPFRSHAFVRNRLVLNPLVLDPLVLNPLVLNPLVLDPLVLDPLVLDRPRVRDRTLLEFHFNE